MTLYEKSQSILELPAVLDMLAARCVSDGAKDAARALAPSSDRAEAERRQTETSDARDMMTLYSAPSFDGVKDIRDSLKRTDAGGMLNTRELTDIAHVLRAARNAVSYASGDESGARSIGYLFSSLHANRYLEDKITNSIVGEGELADSASTELADIRRAMRVAGSKVREALQKIITSPTYAKVLQEPIITVKNGRYVVPVKAEHKGAVPGLTHDISSSGATLFIEPMSAVKANNEIRELLAREEREVERILRELSAEASDFSESIALDYNLLTQLDLIFAKAKLSYDLNCARPAFSDNGGIVLKKARHPLLRQSEAVPIDIELGGGFDTLVITGPNTGGKTVSLKTLGLLCLMAQCGLHIPAGDESSIPLFQKVLADIGDEQSIEQSLSTFSSHMTNIVGILSECGEGTLALFDELGAGTDPAEGAALAVAIIEYARSIGAHIAATTHYAELKIYAMTERGVMNASCEFDVKTLKPTYRLLMGIPGKSNAFAISERLGLPGHIIDDAKRRMDQGDADFEEALSKLEENRKGAEKGGGGAAQIHQERPWRGRAHHRGRPPRRRRGVQGDRAYAPRGGVGHRLAAPQRGEGQTPPGSERGAGPRDAGETAIRGAGEDPRRGEGRHGGDNIHRRPRPGAPGGPGRHPPASGGDNEGHGKAERGAGSRAREAQGEARRRIRARVLRGCGVGAGRARHDRRGDRGAGGAVHRQGADAPPQPGDDNPRQGHRRAEKGRPRVPQALKAGEKLPSGQVRRGRERRHDSGDKMS